MERAASMSAQIVCAWLRNDLRVHDSPVLHRARVAAQQRGCFVLPVYVLDPRHFRRTSYGTLKTGPVRALFLLESILALKRRLRSLGSDLLIKVGCPEKILPPLLPEGSLVLTQEEVTSEELGVDRRLRAAIPGVQWEYCWGSTLFHREDLPFRRDLADMPDSYTSFKNRTEPELACKANEVPLTFNDSPKVESRMKVRPCLPVPEAGSLPLPRVTGSLGTFCFEFEPDWGDLPYAEPVSRPILHDGAVLPFYGGEEAGLARLQYYMRDTQLIATYFETRNEMLGGDYSTKFAPWLAHGCISPRKVFEQLRAHEMERAASKSTYWLLFALGARDFFRFMAAKHGDRIFHESGTVGGAAITWKGGDREFEVWAQGRTGFPFVDANMRELLATGFMSNRGRQNVASFLVMDLRVDWRRGADWFESHLMDYDVTANWVNWAAAAGLTGGRVNRFNVLRQSKNYDPDGCYIRHWVPELRGVPQSGAVHEPWAATEEERRSWGAETYPPPCMEPGAFPRDVGPVPVQLKGRGRGKGKAGAGLPDKERGHEGAGELKQAVDHTPAPRRWRSAAIGGARQSAS